MSDQCTICICDYTEPVSIPCGHVYCMQCLSDYISSSSPDGLTAACPTCRAEFSIVVPELHSLSKQFHRYTTPSIRRVFIEPNPSESYEELKQKFEASEARNAALKRENRDLQKSCQKYMADATVRARGERTAKSEVVRLERHLEMEKMNTKDEITRLRRMLHDERIETRLGIARAQLPPVPNVATSTKRPRFAIDCSSSDVDEEDPQDHLSRSLPIRVTKRVRLNDNAVPSSSRPGSSTSNRIDLRTMQLPRPKLPRRSQVQAKIELGPKSLLRNAPKRPVSQSNRGDHGASSLSDFDSD
ncbi:hypothetical protein ARMSODRAFT_1019158 [Armillaria solidipes]|uniref:RING-type domain-containing protein n=1 Tax=Armillaria solidipes TaxID=1076256 RepID=A0A2H3BE89_9AGAR|nr:hypothetical protein ARMSODRAFT_1019158 [Armillaria solidipes]